jgi:hypothetical protein
MALNQHHTLDMAIGKARNDATGPNSQRSTFHANANDGRLSTHIAQALQVSIAVTGRRVTAAIAEKR